MRVRTINPKTGKPFKTGDIVKTDWGLVARFWAEGRAEGVILIQTVHGSNTWQHSLHVRAVVSE
jgi:hypothetical protein